MIELGKVQKLVVTRTAQNGVYLGSKDKRYDDAVLLPKNQVPEETQIGDEIEVFVYRDSEDRIISTVIKPKLTLGEVAVLNVIETAKFGAFLDWGLEKDLFMPFKEQLGIVRKGDDCLVGLYLDKSSRLCATMKIYNRLSTESSYNVNDWVSGTICNINEDIGAFIAVENKYQGLIPNKELYGSFNEGDSIRVRIKRILPDGKLELSLREKAYNEIEGDARRIMERLEASNGIMPLNDNSSPERIKSELNMSKNAFKRAVGRLLKEGAVEITDEGIKRMW